MLSAASCKMPLLNCSTKAITMYESMKPKDAARIFDRLDLRILVDVSTQMKPRQMAEILAQMSPESAERLTVELATRAGANLAPGPDQLPKIEGKPALWGRHG